MQHRAIVPHDQHARRPDVPVLERCLPLPVIELDQERTGLGLIHALDADNVAQATEQRLPPGLRVRLDQRVGLGLQRLVGGADIHGAPGPVRLPIGPIAGIGQPGRVDGPASLDPSAQGIRQGVQRRVLVGVEGIAAHRGDGDPVEAGARGRSGLEAPVRMPVLREDGRGLVRPPLHGDHVPPPRDRRDERVVAEAAEG